MAMTLKSTPKTQKCVHTPKKFEPKKWEAWTSLTGHLKTAVFYDDCLHFSASKQIFKQS